MNATDEEGMLKVEELLARAAIRDTMSVYATAGDRGRVDELATAFAEDGVLEFLGGRHQGRAAIASALSPAVDTKRAEPPGQVPLFLRHNLTTSRIELTSSTDAQAWTYFVVVTPAGLDHCGVYVDRFVKTGDRWLIQHRRVKIDWCSPESTIIRPD